MDWKSSSIGALPERALIEDKAAGVTTANLTIDPGPGGAPFLLPEEACASIKNLNEDN
ncbi:MAG: hypothetical protein ABSC48_08015 [Terracidiphilus sp.]|jgi:hypothetical protein